MIVIEGIQRFVSPEPITNPKLVLITACAGLGGNIIGLLLFRGMDEPALATGPRNKHSTTVEHGHGHGHGHGHHHHHHHDENEIYSEKGEQHPKQGHLNMKGVKKCGYS